MNKSLVYLQSGGPTSVINSSLYGAIKEAKRNQNIDKILGSLNGIEGLISNDLIDLGKEEEETIELLKQTPGAILGSSRYKLPSFYGDDVYKSILNTINKHNIGYIIVNGGNDSMDTCNKLSKFFALNKLDVNVVGVPKTVDNDLAFTDHCNGFGSAAKYVINTVKSICVDASCYKKGKVIVIEIMGRNAGWLTASIDLLSFPYRPDLIYLPEVKLDLSSLLDEVNSLYRKKGYIVIAFSEGVSLFSSYKDEQVDSFGHNKLEGSGEQIAKLIHEELNLPTRSIILSIPQRADPFLISKVDQEEAINCGKYALMGALNNENGKMVAINRISSRPYKVGYEFVDVSKIANVEKKIPSSFMKNSYEMSNDFKEYLTPLIEGETPIKFKNGIFEIASLKKIKA